MLRNLNVVRWPVQANRVLLACLLALWAILHGANALACAACESMTSRDWQGQATTLQTGWTVGLEYDFINQNRIRQGQDNLSYTSALANMGGPGNEVETQTATRITTLDADYNGDSWGVSFLAPYYDRYHTTLQSGNGGYNYSDTRDPGDARVIGRYTGLSEERSSGLILGAKLPTGQTQTTFALGGMLDRSLQPGTGSTDVIWGAFTTGQSGELGWFAQGTVQHAVAITDGYRPGDAYRLNIGFRYARFGQRLTPLLQFDLVRHQSDSGINANYFTGGPYVGMPITGGSLAYIAPGLAMRLGEGYMAYGYVQLPVYQNVTGVQLVPSRIWTLGIRRNFH